jgi:ribonuclease BN (tRNA processing enzyme)
VNDVMLRFLGTGDAFGSGGRLQTCLHLSGVEEGGVLIDCGTSSLIGLKRAGIDPSEIGWVLLTHLHGDHFGGVPFLILDGQFSRRTRPLVIAGPDGTAARVAAAMEVLFPGSTSVERRFATTYVQLIDRVPAQIGPARTTAYALEHPCGATPYALRVEYGQRIVAYSGDTQWTDALIEAAKDADVFVCEAYTLDREVRFHLDHSTLRRHRARLTPRRMILTHMGRQMLERMGEAEWECAFDGMAVTVQRCAQ